MLNKEECKRALENMHSQVDIETQWYSYDVLKELIDEHFNPKPYKFEDLKPNMWVWDNVAKECLYVVRPFITTGVRVKYFTCLGLYNSLEAMKKLNMKFEENRFFPVRCANLES